MFKMNVFFSHTVMGICSSTSNAASRDSPPPVPAPTAPIEQNAIADLAKGEALLKEAYAPDEAAEADAGAAPAPASDQADAAASGEALLKQALG